MPQLVLSEAEQTILFLLMLGIFAHQGFRLGIGPEIVKLLLTLLGFAIGQPTLLGDTVVKAITGIHFALLFLANGGLKMVLSGQFSANDLAAILDRVSKIPPLITPQNKGLILFALMLLMILLGYALGSKIKRKAPTLGLVLGTVNGLVLAVLFLPALAKRLPIPQAAPPTTISLDSVSQLDELAIRLLTSPFTTLYDLLGNALVMVIIFSIVVLGIRNLRS